MMSKLSLLDKLKVLGEVTSSSGLFMVAIVILIALAALLITTSTRTKKISRYACITIYASLAIVCILFYREEIFQLFDYMMDNFFIAIYFPNLAIYFAAIVATNIILWISIFNRKITKWIRAINTTVFCIIHYLLILIINIIIKNKLDIFDQISIYQNRNAQALIELSSTIFIVWILFLIVYRMIRAYQYKQALKVTKEETDIPVTPAIISEPQITEPVYQQPQVSAKTLPNNFVKVDAPEIITRGKEVQEEPQQEKQVSIEEIMKQPLPTITKSAYDEDNDYLLDIPNPILDDAPQALDIMLRDQEIMKPKKESQQPKPQPKEEPKIEKPIIQEPEIVNTVTNNTKPKEEKPKSTVDEILSGLTTIDDYKRLLGILKTYQQEQKTKINMVELLEISHKTR